MDAPLCKICGKRHYGVCTQFKGEMPKSVHKSVKPASKRVHNPEKHGECVHKVEGMRRVGVRELRRRLASELGDLPFAITMRGVVVAVVSAPE